MYKKKTNGSEFSEPFGYDVVIIVQHLMHFFQL